MAKPKRKSARSKKRWRRAWNTHYYEDDKYGYGHVFKCQNGGLNHGLWIATALTGRYGHHSQHATMKAAKRVVERHVRKEKL